jgi:hypothetical protein
MMGGFFVLTTHVYEEKLPFDIKECELHTLIHTFAILAQPQYLGLNFENAEFLTPLFFSSTSWAEVLVGKVII